MKITDERRSFIHTHFETDGDRLGADDVTTIEREVTAEMRALRLWADARVARAGDGGVEIVLTCQPGERDLLVLREKIAAVIERMPTPRARISVAPGAGGPYR